MLYKTKRKRMFCIFFLKKIQAFATLFLTFKNLLQILHFEVDV